MSESLPKGGEIRDDGWDDMGEALSVTKELEDGGDPEDILKDAYADGRLTPEFMEVNSEVLRQYGLNDDKYEYYEKLSRTPREEESPEEKRRRSDEEPEQEGYENMA